MLNVVMLNVIMLNVIMLNVIMLNVIMLNVVMMIVVMMNVIMLSVVAPCLGYTSRRRFQNNRLPLDDFFPPAVSSTRRKTILEPGVELVSTR
jgi:hypothetical protein